MSNVSAWLSGASHLQLLNPRLFAHAATVAHLPSLPRPQRLKRLRPHKFLRADVVDSHCGFTDLYFSLSLVQLIRYSVVFLRCEP